jgi:hypothetical protein
VRQPLRGGQACALSAWPIRAAPPHSAARACTSQSHTTTSYMLLMILHPARPYRLCHHRLRSAFHHTRLHHLMIMASSAQSFAEPVKQ